MRPYYKDEQVTLFCGDALKTLRELPSDSVNCIATSPPFYQLRDYNMPGQYGLEDSPVQYVDRMREVFAEARRVLADDGTLWLNLGDSYSGSWGNQSRRPDRGGQRPVATGMIQQVGDGRYPRQRTRTGAVRPGAPPAKNLYGIPWKVAFALQKDGWILRNDIIWYKPNGMPENVRDRLGNRHEHLFMLAKKPHYYFDLDAIRQPYQGDRSPSRRARRGGVRPNSAPGPFDPYASKGRNPGDVWQINIRPSKLRHFAMWPIDIPTWIIKAGCPKGGVVLDPFSGAGTTGIAARTLGRRYIGIDLNPAYLDVTKARLAQTVLDLDGRAPGVTGC
ncbi:DNA-methyltransferase [Streptoverticillium reticulum]|uniref:DNA-methyltransferase n=1 Tax=Streptoverticillium reticulum TaxID=1433415 RepID=UPI0039BF2104